MGNLHHVVEQRDVEQHHVTTARALDVQCVKQHTSGANAEPGAIAKFSLEAPRNLSRSLRLLLPAVILAFSCRAKGSSPLCMVAELA